MEHLHDSAALTDAEDRSSSTILPMVRVEVSGHAVVNKLAVIGQAERVITSSDHDVIISRQHNPVALREALENIRSRLAELDQAVEPTSGQLWAIGSAIQNLIAKLRRDAEAGAAYVDQMLPQVARLVTQLERWLPEAVALRVSLVHLYGAARQYDLAIAEAERLLLSRDRAAFTDDIMLLAVALMNACEYSLAVPLFETVATNIKDSSGLVQPPSEEEGALQRATADQYRLLWIPHERGRYEETITNAPKVLATARALGMRVEAGVFHRLGRAQSDLGVATADQSLLKAGVQSHDTAMRRMEGTYNFYMPMARYYAERALHGEGTPALLGETLERSTGLNEGAQAHIHLLEARRAIDAGQYFTAFDLADRSIEMWARHPHPRGVVDALATRAVAEFKIGTTNTLAAATADLRLAGSIARSRRMNLDRTAKSLLAKCQQHVDPSDHQRVLDLVSAFEDAHPRLYQRPGRRLQEILAVYGQSGSDPDAVSDTRG